ncbi:MAG: phosphatase PAP2 family protein [Rubrobacter sp.]
MSLKDFLKMLVRLDRAIFRVVFGVKWNPASRVLTWATVVGSAGAVWGAMAFAGFLATWLFYGFSVWSLVLPWGAVAAAWTVAEGTKSIFNRTRPFIHDKEILPLIKTPSSTSFPSGHSATAAAGATTLSVLYPPLAPLFCVLAFCVMLSRVYLGVHYPFDVLAGATIGAAVSGSMLALAALI